MEVITTEIAPDTKNGVPENWNSNRLSDVCSLVKTKINPQQGGDSYKCIELEHLEPNTGKLLGVTKSKNLLSHKTLFKEGDVLFGKLRPYLRKFFFADFTGVCSSEIWALRSNEKCHNRYLYYLIQTKKVIEAANESTGTRMPRADWTVVSEVELRLPLTISEQKAIATALSDVDALIHKLDDLIEKKQNIKKATMQLLLTGKKRLDGFDGEWEDKTISDLIIKFQNGYAFSAKNYSNQGMPIITMAQIGLDGRFKYNEENINHWDDSEAKSLSNYFVHGGDLIIAMTDVTPNKNLIGRMAIVDVDKTFLLNQRVGLLKVDNQKANPYFLKALSNSRAWRSYCKGGASLGVQANIGTKEILSGTVKVPPIEEQNAISKILITMGSEINSLFLKKSKLILIKKGMMQELLTGKTRLNYE